MKNPLSRALAVTLALSFVLIACGQKPGVHVATGRGGSFAGEGEVLIDPETGEPILPGEEGGPGGASGTGGTTGGTTGGGTSRGGGGAGASSSGGGGAAGPNDKNGVTASKVLVGFHAPLTGAAAVPLTDIQKGVNLYRDWLKAKGVKTHGREIDTIFRDDQYNPSHAVEVCREMVEQRKVFMLVGGAGTDQILACARYAASRGVPYLSLGVTERVVKDLKNYFAFSMSYPQQTKPLAQMINNLKDAPGGPVLVDRCGDEAAANSTPFCNGNGPPASAKVALVYSNTDGFYDARDRFLQEWKAISGKDAITYAITKFNISSGEANSTVGELKKQGADVVFVLTSPTNWLSILRVAEVQRYAPRWVGVGLTKAINTVAQVGCGQSTNSFSNSLFINPWMSVDNNNYSSQFQEAWRAHSGESDDPKRHDIAFGLWGGSIVHQALLEATGRDLGRAKFIQTVQGLQSVKAPDNTAAGNIIDIYSALNYSGGKRFGANQAHLLYGKCPEGRWLDVPGKQFVSSF
ncbi:MAG: ABC transporter substrate-binding protein [Actinobacteria bacterium]|nr:ABC transporter substrate-binding protein [Actinomycetota bacterium]